MTPTQTGRSQRVVQPQPNGVIGATQDMNKLYVASIYKKGWSKTSIFVLIAPDKEAAFGRLKKKYYGDLAEHQCSFHNIHGDSLDDITEIFYM